MAAMWKVIVLAFIFALLDALVKADIPDNLHLHNEVVASLGMQQDSLFRSASRLSKRSLRHHLVKRDSSDSTCQEQEQTFLQGLAGREGFINVYKFINESKFSIALAWGGDSMGRILVSTTEEFMIFAKPSDLYLSVDDGHTFQKINDRINNAVLRKDNGMQKHPLNAMKLYLVAYPDSKDGSDLYITENAGDSFQHVSLPFLLDDMIDFNPSNEQVMMARPSTQQDLFVSKDGGHGWTKVLSKVQSFKWGPEDEKDVIYATVYPGEPLDFWFDQESYDFELKKSSDGGVTWKTLMSNVYSFGCEGKFLYVSVHIDGKENERLMKVSTDGGETWNEAQLPSITPDRFYSILDMTEGLIFMHVDNPGDTGHGTLFTSDSTGIIFSQSLEKHLYPNYHELTDFYKVKSMRGVYIASQLSADNSIHTMITFDRGGEWKSILRPEGVPCKDESKECYLQIHNMYSASRGVVGEPPLSHENAPGIIIAHGYVADALQSTPPDVYITSDGGYTWIKALDGPHHMQIADQGGLLVAVPADTDTPSVIKFSTDEGRCWHVYKFTDEKLKFTGVLTEPGNKAMSVGIWGFGQDDHVWRVITLNFTKVITRSCDDDDYEKWLPHWDNSLDDQYRGCLLGKKETFQRLRKDSWCSNGHAREISSQKTEEKCLCTKDDYECDYGYRRNINSDVCEKDPEFKGAYLDVCLHGLEEEIITEGYRKIPGDECQGGFKPAGEKLIDLKEKCVGGNKDILINEIKPEYINVDIIKGKYSSSSNNRAVFISVVLTTLLLALVMVAYFIHKYKLLKKSAASFRYSMLNQKDDYQGFENDFESALASTSLYEDSSDDELTSSKAFGASNERSDRSMQEAEGNHDGCNSHTTSPNNSQPPAHKPKVQSYHDDSDDDMLE